MRCSVIRRVSTEHQAEKISLTDQLKQCQRAIAERGWQFVEDFNFGAVHGEMMQNHPTYGVLIHHIETDQTDVILTAVLDRALRDTAFWINLCQLLQKYHKLIATPSEIFDPQNLEHELTLNIKSAIGHFERKKIRQRAIMGLNALKDQGGWTGGKPPLGYYYDAADKNRPVKIEPKEAEIVKKILNLSLTMPKVKLCDYINAESFTFRNKDKLTPRMVRRLLERNRLRFYAGLRLNSHGNEIPANWDAIISRTEYIKLMDAKKSRTTTWLTEPTYLLTGLGIFRCGYCGLSVKITYNKQRGDKKYYYCSGYYRGRKFCKNSKSVDMNFIDKIIIDDIIKRIWNIDIIEKGYKLLSESDDSAIEYRLKHQLNEAQKKRERLIHAVENDMLTYAEVENRMAKIREQITQIERKMAELYQDQILIDPNELYNRREAILNLPSFELSAKREIIQLLIEKIILYPQNLFITYRFPITLTGKREVRIKLSAKQKNT